MIFIVTDDKVDGKRVYHLLITVSSSLPNLNVKLITEGPYVSLQHSKYTITLG